MTQVEDWAGRTTSYTYDANNRLISTQRPDGSVETRYYNDAGQLIQQIDQDANDNILTQFDFTYNAAGNITTETNNLPEVQITDETHTLTYTSDNRLDTYDGASVQYDADGNMISGPLNGQFTAYTFNSRNQLTAVGTSSYSYDAEGNRIAVNLNGIQYTDVINPNAALSQLLVRTGPETQIFYVYGLGLIGEQNGTDYKVYHYDLRGSTVLLTDQSGATTDSYQYGPYGELLNHTGSSNTQFLYNGRDGVMTDGNGLYYMRARYYSPEMQRFVSRDSLEGSITDPKSLNRYAYVNGQPISAIDPFGLGSLDAALEGASVHREFGILATELFSNSGNTVYTNSWLATIATDTGYDDLPKSSLRKRPDLVVINHNDSVKIYELKPISYYNDPYLSKKAAEQLDSYLRGLNAKPGDCRFYGRTITTQTKIETPNAWETINRTYSLKTFGDKPGMVYYDLINEEKWVQEKSLAEKILDAPRNLLLPMLEGGGAAVPVPVP